MMGNSVKIVSQLCRKQPVSFGIQKQNEFRIPSTIMI